MNELEKNSEVLELGREMLENFIDNFILIVSQKNIIL